MRAFGILMATAMVAIASPATAALTTWFGQDLVVGNPPASAANSVAARDAFIAALSSHATENFDAIPAFATNPVLNFGTFGTAITNNSQVLNYNQFDAHAFSGSNYLWSDQSITITFANAISSFGLFGSDLNEVNVFGLQLVDTLGNITTLAVPHSFPVDSGANMFFGFANPGVSYISITLFNAPGGQDGFGFDDLIIGTSAVPEPQSWALMIGGFGIVGAALRRRRTGVFAR